MAKTSKKAVPDFVAILQRHFGSNPAGFPVFEQKFAEYERANFQLALIEMCSSLSTPAESLGVVATDYYEPSLAKFAQPATAKPFCIGPMEHIDVTLANGQQLACIKEGLMLLVVNGHPLALLIRKNRHSHEEMFLAEVMGTDRQTAEQFLRKLTRETHGGRAFKGNILSIQKDCYGRMSVLFHRIPEIRRDEIILPESLLKRIERHTISFSRHTDRLRSAKRHLKRGILLHGSPGTGKTLSAMYLAAQMPGRTVILITAGGMGSIEAACKLARMLEPATIILEDADLIGTERGHQTLNANALLFELLNQMDGLAEDADILFILTTNRPEVLESALASRPGRIDQAIEVPPPDADCRNRLIDLYGKGVSLKIGDRDGYIKKTEGVSAAFLRELLRRAAVYAAESQADTQSELEIRDEHLDEALTELLIAGGTLTQSLLAAHVPA